MASEQRFSVNLADTAEWKTGMRDYLEYRDLGIKDATDGKFHAHVLRIKGTDERPATGAHVHELDFQLCYVLKGWCRMTFEGQGEVMLKAGDSCLQPPGIVHDDIECSDDAEILEITSPGDFATHPVEAPEDWTA